MGTSALVDGLLATSSTTDSSHVPATVSWAPPSLCSASLQTPPPHRQSLSWHLVLQAAPGAVWEEKKPPRHPAASFDPQLCIFASAVSFTKNAFSKPRSYPYLHALPIRVAQMHHFLEAFPRTQLQVTSLSSEGLSTLPALPRGTDLCLSLITLISDLFFLSS